MKKRFVCVLLTLIMLLGLVPMGASAASHTTSAAAITVLKQMTSFKGTCYYVSGTEFRTGYGTVCEKTHHFKHGNATDPHKNVPDNSKVDTKTGKPLNEHTITEKNADAALRKALKTLDEKVNSFASSNGLSLSQNQHDALVVFSFNAGTGWMDGNGVVKTVIKKNGTANELLNAMSQWTNNADMNRRKVEVNMYMNGIYSNTVSTNYIDVTYHANGGYIAQGDGYTMHYNATGTQAHVPTASHGSKKFVGWYTSPSDPRNPHTWVPVVHNGINGAELYANFMSVNEERSISYTMDASFINPKIVYQDGAKAGKEKENTTEEAKKLLANQTSVTVIGEFLDANGAHWCKIGANAWVKVSDKSSGYVTNEGEINPNNTTAIGTAVVTANGYLNIRQEAGTDSKIVGALAKSDSVAVYEVKTVNGHRWGRINSGWICLTYTRFTALQNANISDAGLNLYAFTGKASANITPKVAAGNDNNDVQIKNYKEEQETIAINAADATEQKITLTNLAVVNGNTWAKATWKNAETQWKNKDKGETATVYNTRSGWIMLDSGKMYLDPVKYTVAVDSINVRTDAGDAAPLVKEAPALNKGTQVEVNWLQLINENIWGKITVKKTAESDSFGTTTGWINLASKYVTRDSIPTVEEEAGHETGKFATVINTDSLRVRKTGATYGQQIGRLSRGTTVAIWEYDNGWYKVDSNKNGVYDYKEDGWCSEDYLEITNGKTNSTVTDAAGNEYTTDGSGKGIVANTYGGLNVRQGAGTNYAPVGKLLPGTVVEILETARSGKWGRTAQGWVSMDYITMVTYNEVVNTPAGGTTVGSYSEAQKTTTTAVYTGKMAASADVYRNPTVKKPADELIRTAGMDENVTVYELAAVTEQVTSDKTTVGDTTTTTTTTVTTYWARINDGWIQNPETVLSLNALDEKIHTQTDAQTLKVRQSPVDGAVIDALAQGDQVSVTALEIRQDKVWGRVETNEGTGWVRLDYMSEGAIYVQPTVQQNTVTNQVVLGNGSSNGGFVNNSTGYRYTGKVIRANEVNVRSTPSTAASKTTSLKNGQALVIYETTVAENMAWGRCDAGWVYLYYVDLTPVVNGAVDARVVYNENTIIYSDVNGSAVAGTYSRMSTVDIYEIVGKMARTDLGWVNVDNLL